MEKKKDPAPDKADGNKDDEKELKGYVSDDVKE